MGLAAHGIAAVVLCFLASIAIGQHFGPLVRKNLHTNSRQLVAHKGRNPVGGHRRGSYNRLLKTYRVNFDMSLEQGFDDDGGDITTDSGGEVPYPFPYDTTRTSSTTDGPGPRTRKVTSPSTPESSTHARTDSATTYSSKPTISGGGGFGTGEVTLPSTPDSSPDERTDSTTASSSETTIGGGEVHKSSTSRPTSSTISTTSTTSKSGITATSGTTSTASDTSNNSVAGSEGHTHNGGDDVPYLLIAIIVLLVLGIIAVNAASIVTCCQSSKNPREPAGGWSADSPSSAIEYDQSIGAEEAAAIYAQKYDGHMNSP